MSLKFSTLASSSVLFVLIASNGYAQAHPSPTPKVGYIRFWDMLPPTSGAFEVRKAGAPVSEPSLLNSVAYQYSSYSEFPVGRYRLAVLKKGVGNGTQLKLFDVDLKPDTYFTIIASPKGGIETAEMTEDTLDPKAPSGILTIRNYFPGATIVVSTPEGKIGDALTYGQSYTAVGFPRERVSLRLSFHPPVGATIDSRIEPDFKASKRATLLIMPDSYGKFAPVVTFDGKNL